MKLNFWIPLLVIVLFSGCLDNNKSDILQDQKYRGDLEKCVTYMQLAYYINTSLHNLNHDVWQAYNDGWFNRTEFVPLGVNQSIDNIMIRNNIKARSTDCYQGMRTFIGKADSLVAVFRSSSFRDSEAFDELIPLFADIKLFQELADNPHGTIVSYKNKYDQMEENIDRELMIFKLKYGIGSSDKDSTWSANLLDGVTYPDVSELSFSNLYFND